MSALGEDSNSVPLSENLKDGTKKSHREAENVSFVKNFIKGRVSRENYAILTGNLYHVYKTMEECMAKHGKAVLGEMFLPEKLNRTDRLLADWRYLTLQSEDSEIFPEPTPATRDYVKRIQEVSDNEPKSLVAHAYTRYMGDLSGGQILARCARRALNLPETGEGGQFYEFPAIKEGGKVFKNEYRRMLDRLRTTTEEQDMIVGEANVAFVLNMRIFEELDVLSKVPNASVRPLADALSWRTSWKEPGAEGGEVSRWSACVCACVRVCVCACVCVCVCVWLTESQMSSLLPPLPSAPSVSQDQTPTGLLRLKMLKRSLPRMRHMMMERGVPGPLYSFMIQVRA